MLRTLVWMLFLLCCATEGFGKPTIYKRNEDNIYEPLMIPVSSTVIPLPVYKVQYAIGVSSKDKKSPILRKPDGSLKLITGKKPQEKKT